MEFPRFARVRQHFDAPCLDDIAATARRQTERGIAAAGITAGATVAVGAGSRGIAEIGTIVSAVVETLRAAGARPFVFPAMGSHGGATDAGQAEVLAHFGVTEAALGCPVRSTVAAREIGVTADGITVFVDRHAAAADHIVLVNRVKPHTDFRGTIESGIMKMMSVGMGKREGAGMYHRAAFTHGFEHVIRAVCAEVMTHCAFAFGIGILENADERTAAIEMLPAATLAEDEAQLLERAVALQPRLPVEELDLLVVDWMGKNISGTGMDTNVIGRRMHTNQPELSSPRVTRIFVRHLTEESDGNATGIGLADLTTRRLVERMDLDITYTNVITAISPQKARIPVHFAADREVLDAAFRTIGMVAPAASRVIRIASTLALGELLVSAALLPELDGRDDIEIVSPPAELQFDAAGNLPDFDA
jgi:hypothetical protein